MKKSVITKIGILFGSGLLGAIIGVYLPYKFNTSAGVTFFVWMSSIFLVAVSMQMLETELKKIIK